METVSSAPPSRAVTFGAIATAAALLLTLTPATSGAHPPGPGEPPGSGPGSTHGFKVLAHANPGPGANGDVYAHRGVAYLASWQGQGCLGKGIRAYDIRDARRPRLVSTFADARSDPSLRGTWTEKVIVTRVDTRRFHGDLAVVTFQRCDPSTPGFRGFALYDVTRPDRPRALARYSAPGTNGSHEIWLASRDGRAFVYTAIIDSELTTAPDYDPVTRTATRPGRADFRIVDVSDPARPRDVGEWGAWRQLGIAPIDDGRRNYVHSVMVDDRTRRAYLSYLDLGTVILDIADPARPRYLGRTTPAQGRTHSAALAGGGRLLIETHETLGGLPVIWDVADPARPRRLSTFEVEGHQEASVHDPKVRGRTAYFSWYSLGVVAADISDPSRPREVAQFVPRTDYVNPDSYCMEACADVWGVFVYRDLVLASDINSGLYVLRRVPADHHSRGATGAVRSRS